MTIPVTDDFTTGNFGTWWTITQGNIGVSAGLAVPFGTAAENTAYWALAQDTFTADHSAQGTVSSITSANSPGVTVRHSGSAGTTQHYLFVSGSSNGANGLIYRLLTGTSYTLLSTEGAVSNGDVLKLRVSGTTLEGFINGVSQGPFTNSAIATGQPGIYFYGGNARMDDWIGDNAGSPIAAVYNRFMGGRRPAPFAPGDFSGRLF